MRSFKLLLAALSNLAFVRSENVQIIVDPTRDLQTPDNFARSLGDGRYSTRFDDVVWDNDNWTLTTTSVRAHDFHAVAFTSNGYIGLSMASNGPFVQAFAETNGWPVFNGRQTFGTVSGFFDRQNETEGSNFPWLYQYGWDSVISGIPSWGPLIIELDNGKYLDANTSVDQLSNIYLTQDYKTGLAKWQYTWSPEDSDGLSLDITYTAFANKLHVNQGHVHLELQPSADIKVTVTNVLDGLNALRTVFLESGTDGNLIYTAVSPQGVPEVSAWVYSGIENGSSGYSSPQKVTDKDYIGKFESTIAQAIELNLKVNETYCVTKHVGVASTDAFKDPKGQAKNAVLKALQDGYNKSLEDHTKEWAQVMPKTAVSDYSSLSSGALPKDPTLIEKAITSVVSVFSLLMNTISENAFAAAGNAPINVNGISVCGLTSDCYAGQRFWDQDVWMQPYIAAIFPFEAKQISNNRVQQYPQAKKNAQTGYSSSKNQTSISENAAAYPWTSGRDANCTATGPCFDYEYHLGGDIAHSFVTLWASSGDSQYFEQNLLEPLVGISTFFSDILEKNGSEYQLTNMTDPDEYANHEDNGGFTMAAIAQTLSQSNFFLEFFGKQRNTTWDDQSKNIAIPKVGELSLEYTGMNGSFDVKQADVVLKIFPLSFDQNYTVSEQNTDLDYYAAKQSPDGPGMTWAIFSIDAAEISPSGCSAYTYDRAAWSPYARAPWFLFSEQLIDDVKINGGTNPAYPFLTGHGGFLQVDPHGYLGLRYDTTFKLRVNPTLPPQIEAMTYPVFYFHGWPVQAVANGTHTTLERLETSLSTANSTYASAPIVVEAGKVNATTHELPPKGKITLPNRDFVYNKTVPGNILQCHPVFSPDEYLPGQFPIAAVDGAISTVWESSRANASQTITVDLTDSPFQRLKSAVFNWAQYPPVNATMVFHNQTSHESSPGKVTIALTDIKVQFPYDPVKDNEVGPYRSNTTTVNFDQEVWSGNYATLIVSGNQGNPADNATGSTVAEWAVVAA